MSQQDSFKKSLVQGRTGAAVLSLVAVIGNLLNWSDVQVADSQSLMVAVLNAVAMGQVLWSKYKPR